MFAWITCIDSAVTLKCFLRTSGCREVSDVKWRSGGLVQPASSQFNYMARQLLGKLKMIKALELQLQQWRLLIFCFKQLETQKQTYKASKYSYLSCNDFVETNYETANSQGWPGNGFFCWTGKMLFFIIIMLCTSSLALKHISLVCISTYSQHPPSY